MDWEGVRRRTTIVIGIRKVVDVIFLVCMFLRMEVLRRLKRVRLLGSFVIICTTSVEKLWKGLFVCFYTKEKMDLTAQLGRLQTVVSYLGRTLYSAANNYYLNKKQQLSQQ